MFLVKTDDPGNVIVTIEIKKQPLADISGASGNSYDAHEHLPVIMNYS
jgi:hypothetical protein